MINISPLNNTSSLNVKGDLNTLNIVTWNIENFPKNELTPDYVQTIVDSMEVDILALQEIRSLTSLNNIAYNLGDNWVAFRSSGSSNYGNFTSIKLPDLRSAELLFFQFNHKNLK